jgi:hypothetical protein
VGFRDPITSATAVDTGRGPSDAGVRLYQDTTVPAVPIGVAEWRTGQMTRNATAKLSGGGSGGSVFALSGGNTQATDAPELDLNVEQLPGGGYAPVLRLRAGAAQGGRIVPDVALDAPVPMTALPLGTMLTPFGGQYEAPRYTKLASGLVVVTGFATVTTTSFGPGSLMAGPLPAGCRPSGVLRFMVSGWNGGWLPEVYPNGQILYGGATAGTTVSTTYLSFAGIAFAAEQ